MCTMYIRVCVCMNKSRLTVVSHEAKEEAASGTPMDSRLTHMSILHVPLYKSCEN